MQTILAVQSAVRPKAEDHLGLAHKVARQFVRRNENVKDSIAYSVACEELVRSAQDYDPADGPFPGYAWRRMYNRLVDHYRHNNRRKRKGNFEPLTEKGWGMVPDRPEAPEMLPADLLGKLIEEHPDDTDQDRKDRKTLTDVYLRGVPVSDIAEHEGISRVSVYAHMKRYMDRIRQRHTGLIEKYQGGRNERSER